jgi:hypothetical protein
LNPASAGLKSTVVPSSPVIIKMDIEVFFEDSKFGIPVIVAITYD